MLAVIRSVGGRDAQLSLIGTGFQTGIERVVCGGTILFPATRCGGLSLARAPAWCRRSDQAESSLVAPHQNAFDRTQRPNSEEVHGNT